MRLGATLLIASFSLGCASSSAVEELRREIDALRAELQLAREKQERAMARLAAVEEKQKREEGRAASPGAPATRAAAPVEKPPRNLPVIKVAPPPGAPAVPPLPTHVTFTEPSPEALEKILAAEDGPQAGDEEFRRALASWRAGDRPKAAQQFEDFAARFPRHTQADNALLAAASLYFQMQLYTRALDPLEDLRKRYPAGDALPDGLLLSARCKGKLEQQDLARADLTRLLDDFPDTEAARHARTELSRMQK